MFTNEVVALGRLEVGLNHLLHHVVEASARCPTSSSRLALVASPSSVSTSVGRKYLGSTATMVLPLTSTAFSSRPLLLPSQFEVENGGTLFNEVADTVLLTGGDAT